MLLREGLEELSVGEQPLYNSSQIGGKSPGKWGFVRGRFKYRWHGGCINKDCKF